MAYRSVLGTLTRGRRPRALSAGGSGSRGFRFPWGGGYAGGAASSEQLMRSMGAVSTLFAIVERLQTGTSSVEWNLWRKSASGEKADRKLVKSHAALDLWRKPNKFMPGRRFREISQQHMELTGETPWLVVKAGTLPVELWPVRPDRVQPEPHPEEFISNYWYTGGGVRQYLPVDCVIRQMMPNPLDPYRGLGPVQALLTHLDSVKYSQQWNRAFFENDATPGGLIEYEHTLTDPELDQFQARWEASHRGAANAHRVGILEYGMKWRDRTYTMRDMQFVELSELSREIIREGFGFPRPMLGSVDDVNRANAEAGEVVYGRWLLVPRLDRIRDALNTELLPMYGQASGSDLEFDYVPPVPEDRAADNDSLKVKVDLWLSLVEAGVDDEEAARVVGLPPMHRTAPAPAAAAAPPAGPPAAPEPAPVDAPAPADAAAAAVCADAGCAA